MNFIILFKSYICNYQVINIFLKLAKVITHWKGRLKKRGAINNACKIYFIF